MNQVARFEQAVRRALYAELYESVTTQLMEQEVTS